MWVTCARNDVVACCSIRYKDRNVKDATDDRIREEGDVERGDKYMSCFIEAEAGRRIEVLWSIVAPHPVNVMLLLLADNVVRNSAEVPAVDAPPRYRKRKVDGKFDRVFKRDARKDHPVRYSSTFMNEEHPYQLLQTLDHEKDYPPRSFIDLPDRGMVHHTLDEVQKLLLGWFPPEIWHKFKFFIRPQKQLEHVLFSKAGLEIPRIGTVPCSSAPKDHPGALKGQFVGTQGFARVRFSEEIALRSQVRREQEEHEAFVAGLPPPERVKTKPFSSPGESIPTLVRNADGSTEQKWRTQEEWEAFMASRTAKGVRKANKPIRKAGTAEPTAPSKQLIRDIQNPDHHYNQEQMRDLLVRALTALYRAMRRSELAMDTHQVTQVHLHRALDLLDKGCTGPELQSELRNAIHSHGDEGKNSHMVFNDDRDALEHLKPTLTLAGLVSQANGSNDDPHRKDLSKDPIDRLDSGARSSPGSPATTRTIHDADHEDQSPVVQPASKKLKRKAED